MFSRANILALLFCRKVLFCVKMVLDELKEKEKLMNTLQASLLGLIQGLTEFLPVSSSGHLVILEKVFDIKEGVVFFNIALHFATLVAVLIVMKDDVIEMIKHPFSKLTKIVVLATIPTIIIGFLFKDMVEDMMHSGVFLGPLFIFCGLSFILAEYIGKKRKEKKGIEETKYLDAVGMGVAQGIAIMPAISRSGFTLSSALVLGLKREIAIKISFLMSIPIIVGSSILEVKDMFTPEGVVIGVDILPLVFGMVVAGLSGYFAIKFMLKIFAKYSLVAFSLYLMPLGALIILDQFVTHIFF